ncbi:MAG: ABC-type transporter, integral rane subunit [Anaerocolumna sp.]|jgi:simple sugar transport system permease protein|nr:ABC-type transporter, integral rane subunit [Anaerocolumna sp.]
MREVKKVSKGNKSQNNKKYYKNTPNTKSVVDTNTKSFNTAIKKITGFRLFLPLICLAIVLVINLIKTPSFFEITIKNGVLYGYIIDIINRSSELIILAVGMTLVVAASGGTDISVGAVSALSGAVCVYALVGGSSSDTYRIPYVVALFLAALVGLACGAWNGFLVAKLKIQPMVATLILFTAGRGIAQVLTRGFILYVRKEQFKFLGNSIPGVPLPTPIFVAIAVVLITSFVLKKTAVGLYIQTVGINSKAARLVGLNSSRIKFLVYAFCGLCAGITGMIITSRVYSIDANNAGLNIELDAILAVAIGGNSLGGGKFSLLGSVIGAITIQALTTSLYAMKVTADQLPVYKAVVVVIIVALQSPELKRMLKNLKNKAIARNTGKKVA